MHVAARSSLCTAVYGSRVMDFSGVADGPADRHLYQRIAAVIEAAIDSGELRPGQAIPSESVIVQESGATRNTVRKAVKLLRDEGRLYTIAQLGTFVSRPG